MNCDTLIGRFAFSKAGHDKSQLYVIVAAEGDYVYLCDGNLKTLEKPKKKRTKHIQLVNRSVDGNLQDRLINAETIYDEEIKYALKGYWDK